LQVELLFDLNLDRQAVGVPSGFAVDPEAFHGFIAADGVFDRPRNDMMNARAAVGGRRAFEKDERFPVARLFDRSMENAVFVPEIEDSLFDLSPRKTVFELVEFHNRSILISIKPTNLLKP